MDKRYKRKQTKLGLAFARFGYDELNLEDFQFIPVWTGFYIGTGITLDILIKMVGLENYSFDDCLDIASIAEIENIPVPFLHLNQLIANKKQSIVQRIR